MPTELMQLCFIFVKFLMGASMENLFSFPVAMFLRYSLLKPMTGVNESGAKHWWRQKQM